VQKVVAMYRYRWRSSALGTTEHRSNDPTARGAGTSLVSSYRRRGGNDVRVGEMKRTIRDYDDDDDDEEEENEAAVGGDGQARGGGRLDGSVAATRSVRRSLVRCRRRRCRRRRHAASHGARHIGDLCWANSPTQQSLIYTFLFTDNQRQNVFLHQQLSHNTYSVNIKVKVTHTRLPSVGLRS